MKQNHRHLKDIAPAGTFRQWQEVDIVVYAQTDLGYKAAINGEYSGLIYKNEVFADIRFDQPMKGWIKCLRPDNRVDISLQPLEGKHVAAVCEKIMLILTAAGGRLFFADKTPPEEIKNKFQVSKKVFKKAIGVLYKRKKIKINPDSIEIV